MNNKISLCMIVKNEEKYLPQCLNSVKDIVDEIIIVDTGSNDRTVEIAEAFGARIYHFKWNNSFSKARNESLKYASNDWILIMDADDEFCSEDKEKFKALLNEPLDEKAIYSFETLNYCGATADSNNISVNLNPRVFKNNYGFKYEGEVHNQLINTMYSVKDITHTIRIYHYGYLEESIASKNKRNRNISLLEEQLKNEPDNKYAQFNLGNEYFALSNMERALEYYYKSYEKFYPSTGYGFILLEKIILSNYAIREYDKALEFAAVATRYFPKFTDIYFLKAMVYRELSKPTLEIKALEKCIELGEPPSELKFLYGTGGFKAFCGLGNVYLKLKDYETAYKYYLETIRSKPDYLLPIYSIGHILKMDNTPLEEFKLAIERFFDDFPKAYPIIADIFYSEGYYSTSLEYVDKCVLNGVSSDNLMLLKVKCLVRTGAFEECMKMDTISQKSSFYVYFSMCKAISGILTSNYDYASLQINSFKDTPLSDYNKKMLRVYESLLKLFSKETTEILSEDKNEKEYTSIIIEICEILLINKKFDELEIALNLMNLISDNTVLLHLGKLYNKYGFVDMAKKEVIRSIKEFEVFDADGLDILKSN
ncbi:MAG TPA: glycosyltransferase [Clostridiaceae bacterium]